MTDYYRGARKGFWGDHNGFDANQFFLKIIPLCDGKGSDVKGRPAHHEKAFLLEWLDEAQHLIYTNEWFVEHCLVEFLIKLTVLCKRDRLFRETILIYLGVFKDVDMHHGNHISPEVAHENFHTVLKGKRAPEVYHHDSSDKQTFRENIVYQLQRHLDTVDSCETFSVMLYALAYLNIIPSDAFWAAWYMHTEKRLDQFTPFQVYSTLNSHMIMNKKPVESWCALWLKQSEAFLYELSFEQLIKLMKAIQALTIHVNKNWMKKWLTIVPILLADLSKSPDYVQNRIARECLFHLLKIENQHGIWDNQRLIDETLNALLVFIVHNRADFKVVLTLFLTVIQMTKMNPGISLPEVWIMRVMAKITQHFDELTEINCARIVYVLACWQVDVETVRPFVQQARMYYTQTDGLFNATGHQTFSNLRQVLLAQHYFKSKENSIDLGVDHTQLPNPF